ncbi:AsmA-like C-terminal region-containing protein [Candidatus Pelagibacter sp.]|nr:AsmA-like C-terminal region-containing protein [Candidatus Pelagibacter sp.]
MKIILKIFLSIILIFLIITAYLSTIGIETDRFNNQIKDKIKSIDEKTEIELKKIKLVLDPFKLKINIKTIGSKLINQNGTVEIESLKTQISVKSLIENKFSIEKLEISTKSLEVRNLISFLRSFRNSPELFLLEKTIKNGYLIGDIKLEFDSNGNIKKNYEINGFLRDTRLSILKKYNLQKLDLIFNFKKDNLSLSDISFTLNDLKFLSENISVKKDKDDFLIDGEIKHKEIAFNEKNINLLIKPFFSEIDFEKLRFSSNNRFSFKANRKFEFRNFVLESDILVDEFSFINKFELINFFPNIKENFYLSNHKLSIKYLEDDLYIDGKGDILIQENKDTFKYSINKKKGILDFKTSLRINDNPLKIKFLNYEKANALIQLEGSKNKKDEINIKDLIIDEKKNKIRAQNIKFNKKFEIVKLGTVSLNYSDQENQKNQIKFYPLKNRYILEGSSFNANSLINDLLFEDKNSNFFNINTRIEISIDKIFLDDEYDLLNLNGNIFFKNKEIVKANLNGSFPKNKKLNFTINTNNNNKITTLYIDNAEPIVKRYKFIKGFDNGTLDFYSSKKFNESTSTLKIYDFNLKELPALTKILTLASLQGIADILSGEGIGFDEFEMNFKSKQDGMVIDEIYAIGPAISILMDGYVEKDKLVSLRGTLVPATTVNKFIGSLPVLGKILVGSKTGEGVFGVSFKIKGPPKKLETSVNPIKTLTPRFITRTLEKIKKN